MRSAILLILLLGTVSLFGDIVYEGARSVTGPFLYSLGASAAVVGLISGIGEFAGYGLRLVSGHVVDRTSRYWTLVFVGYGMILAVPLLALAGRWEVAAVLILIERMGKAVRTPAREVILSSAGKSVGRGWAFGIHEAMDQVGAFIGPLIFIFALGFGGGYKDGFKVLFVPGVLTLAVLVFARVKFPEPHRFEQASAGENTGIPRAFWLYLAFMAVTICGFANFQLVSFHFKARAVVAETRIPLLYAVAMGVDAVVALIVGKVYDRKGFAALVTLPLVSMVATVLVFSSRAAPAVIGVVFWGAAIAIHETIMRASIADLVPLARRGWSYGIFNTVFGLAWFVGSLAIGLLYGASVRYVIAFAVILQLAGVPLFIVFNREAVELRRKRGQA